MTLLLTNDDGIDAPGIRALQQALPDDDLLIVAPQQEWSGCGHRVTTQQPIAVETRSDHEFAVGGTPADCVRIGLFHLSQTVKAVVSGINPGGNLGADVYMSGTVAAVREAAFHRIPAFAISHYRNGSQPIDWDYASQLAAPVLQDLMLRPHRSGTYWNINLPHLPVGSEDPDIVFCHLCTQPLPVKYQITGDHYLYSARYKDRQRDPGSDVELCLAGRITVTLLTL